MTTTVRLFEGRFGRLMLLEAAAGAVEREAPEPTVLLLHGGGASRVRCEGEVFALDRGQIMLLSGGSRYVLEPPAGEDPARVVLFQASVAWLTEGFPALRSHERFAVRHVSITARIRQLADTMAIEAVNDQFLSGERLEFMLQELVLSMLDSYFSGRRAEALWRGSRYEDTRIRRAIALLRARPNKELNIDALATKVGLSRSRFYHLFQLCTGRSPREYLDMLCVETAIAKLASSDAPISDVSSGLGFSAQSNFTRFFLNQVGIAPSRYRRAAGGAPAAAPPPASTLSDLTLPQPADPEPSAAA